MNTNFQIKSSDIAFVKEQIKLIEQFIETKEKEYAFEPMNAYYRKLMHQLAENCGCTSNSAGEGELRHVVFVNDGQGKVESNFISTLEPKYHFGDKLFFVDQRRREVLLYLLYDGSIVSQLPVDNKSEILSQKVVSTGVFKIKNNMIIEKTDEQW